MGRFNYKVKVFPFKSQSKAKAFAQLIIEDIFTVTGFRIVEGRNGLFVSAPQTEGKDKNGERKWYNDVFFMEDTPDGVYQGPFQEEIYNAILDEYRRVSNQNQNSNSGRASAAKANGESGPSTQSRPKTPNVFDEIPF